MICQPLFPHSSRSPTRIAGFDSAEIGLRLVSPIKFLGRQRLPTDSIGTCALTLTGLVAGSAVRIEIASTGALVEFRTATLTSEVFSVPVYAGGSANNDLKIKVRKATSTPIYKPFATLVTVSPANQSVYIAQVADE